MMCLAMRRIFAGISDKRGEKREKRIAPDFSTFDQVDTAIKKLEVSSASFEKARNTALLSDKLSKGKIRKSIKVYWLWRKAG